MRQQTKPFIVEIKPSRKAKADNQKTSIWGKLDLSLEADLQAEPVSAEEPVVEAGRPSTIQRVIADCKLAKGL